MQDNKTTQIGPGFLGLLALIFITLKLTGVVAWSWLWVLAPLWIPLAIVLVVLIVLGLIGLGYIAFSAMKSAKNERAWREARLSARK